MFHSFISQNFCCTEITVKQLLFARVYFRDIIIAHLCHIGHGFLQFSFILYNQDKNVRDKVV